MAVLGDGHPVSKGGIDFAKETDAGAIWQLATHPRLQGLGLATALIGREYVTVPFDEGPPTGDRSPLRSAPGV